MLVEKVLLFWEDFLLLSSTRTLNIGMFAFPSCQLHKFLALEIIPIPWMNFQWMNG